MQAVGYTDRPLGQGVNAVWHMDLYALCDGAAVRSLSGTITTSSR